MLLPIISRTFLILLSLLNFTNAEKMQGFPDINLAVEYFITKSLAETESMSFCFRVNGNITGISKLRAFVRNNRNIVTWTQHSVTNEALRWEKWRPGSCMYSNEYGSDPISIAMTGPHKSSTKPKKGFNFEFGEKAAIESDIFYSSGQDSSSEVRTYNVPAHSYAQLWVQKMVVQQNQQFRKCERPMVGGKKDITCDSWSSDVQGNISIPGRIKYGWRTDYKKIELDSCGDDVVVESE